MDWMSTINLTCTIISLITIMQCIIVAIKKATKYFGDLIHLDRALQFSKSNCCISLSVFKKDIIGSSHDYVTFYSAKSYQELSVLLRKRNISIEPMSDIYNENNKIYIGGPSANVEVNSILTRFEAFKYYTEPYQKETYEKNKVNQHFIIYSEEKKGYMFGNKFFDIDKKSKDIGIFIRIPENKKKGILYTTHIIFAAWDIGTYKAVEFFVNNYKIISKKFKDNPYCFVISISRIDNSPRIISVNEIQDVSQEFFGGTDIIVK